MVRVVNRGDEIRQLVLGQRSLDQWKEDPFLVVNVVWRRRACLATAGSAK
jgi:hypothetical protein